MGDGEESAGHDSGQVEVADDERVFNSRGGNRLVRNIHFHKSAGSRPHALRVQFTKSKATSLTLKNTDFFVQYRRAVDLMADFLEIERHAPVRDQMQATAAAFLDHYGLHAVDVTVGKGDTAKTIQNVVRLAEDDAEPAAAPQRIISPATLIASDGRVRAITFKRRTRVHPARIQVRLTRGRQPSFSLENTSFSEQYRKAVTHLADALHLPPDDPLRRSMEQSGPAFLDHYALVTGPLNIPDAVVNLEPREKH